VYQFRDITADADDTFLPAEAVNFNGVQLDTAVPYFRTLQVTGRELIASDIDSYEVGNNIGEYFRSRKVGTREIEVVFQVKAPSDELYRETFNKLNLYLQAEEAKLIFNDEPDKYFIASSSDVSEPDAGCNCGTGKIRFTCSDPRKYSTTTKTFTAETVNGILTANVVNGGNVPVPIDYEITMSGDNGYIGIVSDHGAMQYGFISEADGETYEQSEVLKNTEEMFNAPNDPTGTQCVSDPTFVVNGELGAIPWSTAPAKKYLTLTKDVVVGAWHGGQKTIEINADSEGHVGAKNFMCYWRRWFQKGRIKQRGFQSIFFLDANKKPICGTRLGAYSLLDGSASLDFVLNGKTVRTISTTVYGENDLPYNANRGHDALTKEGSKVIFYYAGNYYTHVDTSIENTEIKYIQINISNWASDEGLTRNYLGVLTFTKYNVEKWRDNPNRYGDGDVVTIDGNDGKVYVNGLAKTGDEVKGTTYFPAYSGANKIEFYYSAWAQGIQAKAKIREAWL
jgi:predicted phage tail component-like protein